MIDTIRTEIERMLDEAASKHVEGIKCDVQRAEVFDATVALLRESPRDLHAEAELLVMQVSRSTRRLRRKRMAHDIDALLDVFTEADDGAYVDPLLDLAYPIGTEDGRVKTLRYWTAEDFDTSTRMAYRKAAEGTAAVRDHDDRMQRAVESMKLRGVTQFGVGEAVAS